MGKLFRSEKTAYIHEGSNFECLQEAEKFLYGLVGVSNGENFNAFVVGGIQKILFKVSGQWIARIQESNGQLAED